MKTKNKKTRIKDLLVQAGKHLRDEFEYIKKSNPHYAKRGEEAEKILREFLNNHLPKRFAAGTGLVVDNKDNISLQTDVLIYDALNSPIYRADEDLLILPSDNVAIAIEVKSKLNKKQLEDAAKKISSVKSLKKSPVTSVDQPVTLSPLRMTKTLGVVFAFEASSSLETLAKNLKDINKPSPSPQWIDRIVVLDKGIIGYTIQFPFEEKFPGWFGGACDDEFPPPPFYIHLVKTESGKLTLNRFFVDLMAHLTFYRKRSSIDFEAVLGHQGGECMTLNAYQYNLNRELVNVTDEHKQESFRNPTVRYNLFTTKGNKFVGQICHWPWQDGAVIMYSGLLPPQLIFQPYFEICKTKGVFVPGKKDTRFWLSSLISISEEKFIKITESMKISSVKTGNIVIKRDSDDENDLPWLNREDDKGKSSGEKNS